MLLVSRVSHVSVVFGCCAPDLLGRYVRAINVSDIGSRRLDLIHTLSCQERIQDFGEEGPTFGGL